jgi:Predicted RNA-binding protein (consists of S1 domain and a Zn-ribbon domain)
MSRVQKKPIRRRLKDAVFKTEEPASEPVEVASAPAEKSAGVPRKQRPEAAAKPEIEQRAGRVNRTRAPTESNREDAEKPERVERPRTERPVRSERPERSERPVRSEQSERGERPERNENSERPERSDRSGKDRPAGRGDRNGGRGGDRNGGRGDRKGGFGDKKPAKKKRPEKIVYEVTKQFVFPGEAVGAIEEYKSGFGTVNDDGTIRATVSGVVGINKEHRMISIIPKTKTLNTITEGDVVIASITDVRESNARVDIVAAEKSLGEEIVNNGNAEIYVSNIKDGFTKAVSDEFHAGDIVRAKVIDSSKIGLSTVDADLGVLKAYCSRCKTSLTRNGDELVCGNCGNREKRKLAEGYGKGIASS